MIHIKTQIYPKLTVITKRGERVWSVAVYTDNGKTIPKFGMMYARELKTMGENHLKMIEMVLANTCHSYSNNKEVQHYI